MLPQALGLMTQLIRLHLHGVDATHLAPIMDLPNLEKLELFFKEQHTLQSSLSVKSSYLTELYVLCGTWQSVHLGLL